MNFTGNVTEIRPVKTGKTQAGEDWASVEFELTESNPHNPDYPQIALFSLFKKGDNCKFASEFEKYQPVGTNVEVEFNFKCQSYTDKENNPRKFYKNEAWKVTKLETPLSHPPVETFETITEAELIAEEDQDQLPF